MKAQEAQAPRVELIFFDLSGAAFAVSTPKLSHACTSAGKSEIGTKSDRTRKRAVFETFFEGVPHFEGVKHVEGLHDLRIFCTAPVSKKM